ncbi:hypothetical protein J3Q00_07580 [Pseudomonas sp. D2-3]
MLRKAALAGIAAVLGFSVQAGDLVDKQDRFTQNRELKWISDFRSEAPAKMGLSVSIVFTPEGAPSRALVHLSGSFDRLEYVNCHMTDWLADGVPVKPSSTNYQVLPLRGSSKSLEVVTSVLTIPQVKQLAAARSVEYRVCRDEGRVPVEDKIGLFNVVSRL